MIKNIIFDLGGVILKDRNAIMPEFLSTMFSLPKDKSQEIWNRDKKRLQLGELSSSEFLTRIKKELKNNLTSEELVKEWKDLYKREAKEIDPEVLDLIEKLKRNYKVYLMTNTIDVHDNFNSKRGIYEKFNKVFKSFEEGWVKPEKNAYLSVLERIKANPRDCLFIDDLEENVQRAIEVGMEGIVYQNIKQLKRELQTSGVSL